MSALETLADLVVGAFKVGKAIADAVRKVPSAIRRKPRPHVHVPTQAERARERQRPRGQA